MKKVFLSLLVASMMLAGCGKDKVENGSNSKSESTTKNDLQNSLVGTSWIMRSQGEYGEESATISFTSESSVTWCEEHYFYGYNDGRLVKFTFDNSLNYAYSKGKGVINGFVYGNGIKAEAERIVVENGRRRRVFLTAVFDKSHTSASVTIKEGGTTQKYTYRDQKLYSNGQEVSTSDAMLSDIRDFVYKIWDEYSDRREGELGFQILSVTETYMTVSRAGESGVFARLK